MFGRNDFLGEVMMPLENKVFDDPTPQVYTLQERVGFCLMRLNTILLLFFLTFCFVY